MASNSGKQALQRLRSFLTSNRKPQFQSTTTCGFSPESSKTFSSISGRRNPRFLSRLPVELGGMQSLMPLHSATASALLNSMLSSKVGQWGTLSEDDAMAIFLALRSPEITVIGLTTIYGNVYTTLATRNALHLMEVAGRTDIPVAEGSHVSYMKAIKLRVADFVHGVDGLGNQNFPQPKSKPIEKSAAEYLVEQANLYPGEVTVVALGPLTNIALAIELDPAFTKNIGQIVILGGAFAVNGNVNPAAEANGYLVLFYGARLW